MDNGHLQRSTQSILLLFLEYPMEYAAIYHINSTLHEYGSHSGTYKKALKLPLYYHSFGIFVIKILESTLLITWSISQ